MDAWQGILSSHCNTIGLYDFAMPTVAEPHGCQGVHPSEPYPVLMLPDLQHMASVNGMPPLQNGMMHAASQHPAAQQSHSQQQPGMVPVSAVQQDPMGMPGAPVGLERSPCCIRQQAGE